MAFWLLIAVALVDLTRLITRIATMDWPAYLAKEVHSFVHNGHQLQVTPEQAIRTAVFSWSFALVFIAVEVVLAFLIRGGMNWVRVLLTIGGALSAASPLFGFDPIVFVESLASVAIVVLIWLPRSNRFYRDVAGERRVHRSRQLN